MIENFNDYMTFIVLLLMPILVLFIYYRNSEIYKYRKRHFSRPYFDEIFDGKDDEIDY